MSLRRRLADLERKAAQVQPEGCVLCAPSSERILITPDEEADLISGVCPRCNRTFKVSYWFQVAGPLWAGEIERTHASVVDGGLVFTFGFSCSGTRKEDFHDPTADWHPDREYDPEELGRALRPPPSKHPAV